MTELGSLTIKDVMSSSVAFVRRDDKISDIISKMSADGIHELPVVDGENTIGIVTYNTLLKKKNFPLTAKAEAVMQSFPQLSEWDPLMHGIQSMIDSGLKDLPVLRNGKLIGIVYRKDMLPILTDTKELGGRSVSEVMTPKPESVREDDDVKQAQSIMRGLDEKNLPVVDSNGRIVGVIGMKDIIRTIWRPIKKPTQGAIGHQIYPMKIDVGSIMSRPPITIAPENTLKDAVDKMIKRDISTLFVIEDAKLVGVITPKDIIEQALGTQPSEGVYVQITGLEVEDPDIYDSLYAVIQKGMIRIAKFSDPNIFNVHVAMYHHEGLRSKYSVHARLTTTSNGMFFSKNTNWDIFKAMDDVLEVLEKEVKKQRGKSLSKRRKHKM
ncbi:MAG TPA: CBS domain-containing protein [Euryarchaeota archaeon]|nr:CBS domain-containing protein [Euryarchaeota archaeon]